MAGTGINLVLEKCSVGVSNDLLILAGYTKLTVKANCQNFIQTSYIMSAKPIILDKMHFSDSMA